MIQKKPTDEEIGKWRYGYRRLSDYSTKIFKGSYLHSEEPDFLGDCKHVTFFDKEVESKLEDDKNYKCWYSYHDAADPADSSTWYNIAYVEEVPEFITEFIENLKKLDKYMREK